MDPAVEESEWEAFEELCKKSPYPISHHSPSIKGMDSLYKREKEVDLKALIILGSAASIYDNLPWQQELHPWLESKIKKGIPKSYYHLFNVEKRWQSSGSRKDFLLIDAIFRRTIKKFNYKFYENLNFYRIVCGYLYYFTKYNQQKKYRYTWILHALKNIIRKFFILIFPKLSLKMFGYF